jgi:uncharacterized protein
MTEAEKKEITQRFYVALGARDINLLKDVLTDDIIWSLPGKSLMSGEAHGVDAILKRAEILSRYGVKVEIEHVVYGFKDVALHLHNTGKHGGKILDEHLTNVYVLRGNKIGRIDTFISDVDMLNAFLSEDALPASHARSTRRLGTSIERSTSAAIPRSCGCCAVARMTGPKFGCGMAPKLRLYGTFDGVAIHRSIAPVDSVGSPVAIEAVGPNAAQDPECIARTRGRASAASNRHRTGSDIEDAMSGNICINPRRDQGLPGPLRGQLREWGRPAERVRKTPNKRQFRCGAEDARLVPLPDLSMRSIHVV